MHERQSGSSVDPPRERRDLFLQVVESHQRMNQFGGRRVGFAGGSTSCSSSAASAAKKMDFPDRLEALRKERGLTQQAFASAIGVHVTQLRRYEAGTSQPTLDVLRKMAVVLRVSADLLLFDKDERGPDAELRLQFEAISRLDRDEKKVVKSVLESILIKHDAKRWLSTE